MAPERDGGSGEEAVGTVTGPSDAQPVTRLKTVISLYGAPKSTGEKPPGKS